MKILLLSPYDALSHQYWRKELIQQLSEHEFTVVCLPARYFSWRFRGNSLTLAHDEKLQQRYDLVIATSMTDLAALKGMCDSLARVPTILYFHENQFAYPEQGSKTHLVERQITNLYSAVTATKLVFNSEFNRQTFLKGCQAFLAKMPDGVPDGLAQTLQAKSQVVAVPLSQRPGSSRSKSDLFSIVWNHRWEYDKGLALLASIVKSLLQAGFDFRFHLIGQSFRQVPAEIKLAKDLLMDAGKLGELGFVEEKTAYLELLQSSHLVLSTASHEFQGIAVQEAMAAGCVPLVPDDLAYREFVPAGQRYKDQADALSKIASHYHQFLNNDLKPMRPAPQTDWSSVQVAWRGLVNSVPSDLSRV